ncbi:hypothetical protein [Amycolatopsis sp. CA-230715]|uniref:hypothetical protein n=1 Tax=Amycolatopsis sp. CA-230715 TaxID=2745196 RepID=UPI001C01419F|nr:hypothetical protein [Amycolatopsis sp. CA-230715]QWF77909.1 hypothetical protein HUW46_01302 [Amycolatopsis sp. CA-230715]
MTPDSQAQREVVDQVTITLTREFGGRLSEGWVRDIVRGARHDLDGQIVPEALGEMLHRLASHRLTRVLHVG